MGSKRKCKVPSRHTVLSSARTGPSGPTRKRSSASGGEENGGRVARAGGIVGGPRCWRADRSRRGGLAPAVRVQVPGVWLVAEAADAGAGAGPQGDAALTVAAHEPR